MGQRENKHINRQRETNNSNSKVVNGMVVEVEQLTLQKARGEFSVKGQTRTIKAVVQQVDQHEL